MTKVLEHQCNGYVDALLFADELRATREFKRVRVWIDREGNSIVSAWK